MTFFNLYCFPDTFIKLGRNNAQLTIEEYLRIYTTFCSIWHKSF